MLPLGRIVNENNAVYHHYADDTQNFLALAPNNSIRHSVIAWSKDGWMQSSFFQLNHNKTKYFCMRTKWKEQELLPNLNPAL